MDHYFINHPLADTEKGRLKIAYAWLLSPMLTAPEIMVPYGARGQELLAFGGDYGAISIPTFKQFCNYYYQSDGLLSGVAALDENDFDRISFLLIPDHIIESEKCLPRKRFVMHTIWNHTDEDVIKIIESLVNIAKKIEE